MHAQLLQSCQNLMTLNAVASQAPLSMGFSKQEYWSGHGWEWQPTRVFLPGESHGQRSLVEEPTVHRVAKSRTWLSMHAYMMMKVNFLFLLKAPTTKAMLLIWVSHSTLCHMLSPQRSKQIINCISCQKKMFFSLNSHSSLKKFF